MTFHFLNNSDYLRDLETHYRCAEIVGLDLEPAFAKEMVSGDIEKQPVFKQKGRGWALPLSSKLRAARRFVLEGRTILHSLNLRYTTIPLVIVDIDKRDAGLLAACKKAFGDRPIVERTPRGWHLYYLKPESWHRPSKEHMKRLGLGENVDLFCTGDERIIYTSPCHIAGDKEYRMEGGYSALWEAIDDLQPAKAVVSRRSIILEPSPQLMLPLEGNSKSRAAGYRGPVKEVFSSGSRHTWHLLPRLDEGLTVPEGERNDTLFQFIQRETFRVSVPCADLIESRARAVIAKQFAGASAFLAETDIAGTVKRIIDHNAGLPRYMVKHRNPTESELDMIATAGRFSEKLLRMFKALLQYHAHRTAAGAINEIYLDARAMADAGIVEGFSIKTYRNCIRWLRDLGLMDRLDPYSIYDAGKKKRLPVRHRLVRAGLEFVRSVTASAEDALNSSALAAIRPAATLPVGKGRSCGTAHSVGALPATPYGGDDSVICAFSDFGADEPSAIGDLIGSVLGYLSGAPPSQGDD